MEATKEPAVGAAVDVGTAAKPAAGDEVATQPITPTAVEAEAGAVEEEPAVEAVAAVVPAAEPATGTEVIPEPTTSTTADTEADAVKEEPTAEVAAEVGPAAGKSKSVWGAGFVFQVKNFARKWLTGLWMVTR